MFLGIAMCTMANVGINLGTNIIKLAFNRRQHEIELEEEALEEAEAAKSARVNGARAGSKGDRSSFVLNPISEVDVEMLRDAEKKDEKKRKHKTNVKPIYKWRSWQLGFIIFKTSNVVNFVSLGFGKQSVLASLSSVQFVSNLVFCYFVLHERLGLNDVLGTISIIAGVVICIVANSSGKSKTYTVDELITLMKDGTYITYCGVLALLAVLAYMTYTGDFYAFKLKTAEEKKKGEKRGKEKFYTGTDMSPVKHSDKGDLVFERIGPVRVETLRPLCFAAYSAVIGTQVVTFAKITMLQIRLSIDGEQQFDKFLTYVFIVGMIVTGIFWDKQINNGLRKFDALVIVPIMQSFWTIFAICNGGMFFQEFKDLSTDQISIFCSGMIVMLFGMGLLMWHEDDVFEEDLEFCEVGDAAKVDEDDSSCLVLKGEAERRIMKRASTAGRASVVLFADSLQQQSRLSSTSDPSRGNSGPLKRLSSTKTSSNPLASPGEGGEDANSLPDVARPKRSQTLNEAGVRKKRTSIAASRSSRGSMFTIGGTRKGSSSRAVGKVRTLSVAATSGLSTFSAFGMPKMESLEEED